MKDYSLQPFPSAQFLPDLTITGDIARHSCTFVIRYALLGDLAELLIPAPVARPVRKDGLWEEMCFEFFLAIKDAPQYWEFNLSTTGHWAVYRFAAYRQGMQAETAFMSLPFSLQNQPETLLLALELDLNKLVLADQALEVGISAVIKLKDGEVTYWALAHPGSQADFHLRDSFTIEL